MKSFREKINEEYENWVICSNNGKKSQRAFAEYLGLANKWTIQRYLSGSQMPQTDDLVLIAKRLDVSIDYLCGLTNIRAIGGLKNSEELDVIINNLLRERNRLINKEIKELETVLNKTISKLQDEKISSIDYLKNLIKTLEVKEDKRN